MARYRPIYINIWEDEDEFLKYSDAQKTLFFYLITNKDCTESGIYKVSRRSLCFILNWDEPKLMKTLTTMRPNVYTDNTYSLVFIKNFLKFNGMCRGRPDLIEKSILADFKLYCESPLWSLFKTFYPKYSKSIQILSDELGKTIYEYDHEDDNKYELKHEDKISF
jgi:hypothetical protein